MRVPPHNIFRFEEYTLDVTRGCLQSGGRDVALRPKSFDVLRYLVENADRLVTKDELLRSLWPKVIVTDDSLTRRVSEVRTALGDHEQRILKTVPRRGYKFAASVSLGKQLVPPDRPSIAVLPFANAAGDVDQGYLSDGLCEDLTTSLSKFSDLFVIAHNSAARYRDEQFAPRLIGQELGVRYLLRGSIRRDDRRLRIVAQLVDASTSMQIWAENYDCSPAEIFTIQDEVIRKIAVTLVSHIGKMELDRALKKPPEDLMAHDYLLRGHAAMRNWRADKSGEAIVAARRYYEQTIAADPEYAPALHALAYTYLAAWVEPARSGPIALEYQQQAALDRALSLAQKAVDLDGSLAEGHATLAAILLWCYRHSECMAEFDCALRLNPNLVDGRLGLALVLCGRAAESIEYMQRIMRLDPFHPSVYFMWLGAGCYLDHRYSEAMDALMTASSRMTGFVPAYIWLAATAAQLGRREEAQAAVANALKIHPDLTIDKWLEVHRLAQAEDSRHLADGMRQAGLS